MEDWESRLMEDLGTIVRLNVRHLSKIISVLDEASRQKWLDTLKEEIHEACTLFVEEAKFFVSIQYLRRSCSKLCDLLQIQMPHYDSEKLTLFEEKNLLKRYLKEFEEEIKDKQDKYKEMTFKQVTLCRQLERIPMIFVEKTIPTNAELENFTKEIDKLETEWKEIENKFYETKSKILNVIQELNIEICTEIQNIISPANNAPVTITKDNVQRLINYYQTLEEKQTQEEHEQLDSLKMVINDLYDTCHIAIPDRHITQNINNHSLDEIQTEISKLKSYWEENENTFLLFEDYNHHWMKLSKLMEECQKHKCVNKKLTSIKGLCEQIHHIEEKLINIVMNYEKKHVKQFTTFGQTIPDVIAKLHDSFGKSTITETNVEKTLSAIISDYGDMIMEPQCETVDKEIENILTSHDSDAPVANEFIEGEKIVEDESDDIREDSPLLIEKRITIEEPTNIKNKITLQPSDYNSQFDVNLQPIISRENNINVNINNQETPVQVSIYLNTPSSSNTTLKIGKSKHFNKYKAEKRTPYQPLPNKDQNTTAPNEFLFQPEMVQVIRNMFKDRNPQ